MGGMRARLSAAPDGTPYRCFLPDLAEFGNQRRSGPGHQPTTLAIGYMCRSLYNHYMAEREGFEPSIHLVSIYALSKRAPSATRTSLHSFHLLLSSRGNQPAMGSLENRMCLLARPARFERATFGPAIRRSIQLSYGRKKFSYSAAT